MGTTKKGLEHMPFSKGSRVPSLYYNAYKTNIKIYFKIIWERLLPANQSVYVCVWRSGGRKESKDNFVE